MKTKKAKKPSKSEMLPSRMSKATIVKGDPFNRSMSNYKKDAKKPVLPSIMSMLGGAR